MYEEYFEERDCDHDDEVMCNHVFFDNTMRGHMARARFRAMLQAKTHWVVGVTPDCVSRALHLEMLHRQRCEDLDIHPLMCLLPRDRFSLDDILQVIGVTDTSREVIESKSWILLSSGDVESHQEAINRWINVDPVLN
jgi:hypothetical protein